MRLDPVARQGGGNWLWLLWSSFVARANGEKVVVRKLLSEDKQEQRLFHKEAKILHAIRSKHVVKFTAACTNPCAMMLESLLHLEDQIR